MNLEDYKENEKKQLEGARVAIGGAVFTIRRLGTRESDKKLSEIRRKKTNPYEVLEDWERSELDKEITGEWLATYGVADWAGVYPPDGTEELPYSQRNAWEIFTDPQYYLSLNAALIQKASDINVFLNDKIKDDIEEIKKQIDFDVQFPTKEERLAYSKHAAKLNTEAAVPKLNAVQNEILRVLYEADRDRSENSLLTDEQINQHIEYVPIDLDLALSAIKELDAHLIKQRVKKHDRQADKGSSR